MTMIVGEIGVNHLGSFELARQIINKHRYNVNMFKVQMRTPELCVNPKKRNEKKVVGRDRVVSYFDYKKENELNWEEVFHDDELWFASVWDKESAKRYKNMKGHQNIVKIPAILSNQVKWLEFVREFFYDDGYRVFISIAPIDLEYSEEAIELIEEIADLTILTFMSYTSVQKYSIREMLKVYSDDFKNLNIDGYSSHSGKLVDNILALCLFDYLEVHIAVEESYLSSDWYSSLLPNQTKQLYKYSNEIFECGCYTKKYVDKNKQKSLLPYWLSEDVKFGLNVERNHYEIFKYEPIDFMNDYVGNFYVAKVFKYIVRYPFKHKDKTKDLNKALYTLRKMLKNFPTIGSEIEEDSMGFFINQNNNVLTNEQIELLNILAKGEYSVLETMLVNLVKKYDGGENND